MENKPTVRSTNRPNNLHCVTTFQFFVLLSFRGEKKLLPCHFHLHGRKYKHILPKRKCLRRKYYISHKKNSDSSSRRSSKANNKTGIREKYVRTQNIYMFVPTGARIQLNIINWHTLRGPTLCIQLCEIRAITIMVYMFAHFSRSFFSIASCLLFIHFFFFDLQSLPFTQSTPCDK